MKNNENRGRAADNHLQPATTYVRKSSTIGILVLAATLPLGAHAQLAPATARAIDTIVAKALEDKSVPSVSIAIVKGGKLVYAQAYGMARIDRSLKATPQMRYKIGSNTK